MRDSLYLAIDSAVGFGAVFGPMFVLPVAAVIVDVLASMAVNVEAVVRLALLNADCVSVVTAVLCVVAAVSAGLAPEAK